VSHGMEIVAERKRMKAMEGAWMTKEDWCAG